ncbi:MAG: hypothetical protein RLZZ70_116 [Candidatus Parcubacteria bacterium]|jgi:hypothetical protein
MKNNNVLVKILLINSVFVAIIIGVIVYFNQSAPEDQIASDTELQQQETKVESITADQNTNYLQYKNTELGVSFAYPKRFGTISSKQIPNESFDLIKSSLVFYGENDANKILPFRIDGLEYDSGKDISQPFCQGSTTNKQYCIEKVNAKDTPYFEVDMTSVFSYADESVSSPRYEFPLEVGVSLVIPTQGLSSDEIMYVLNSVKILREPNGVASPVSTNNFTPKIEIVDANIVVPDMWSNKNVNTEENVRNGLLAFYILESPDFVANPRSRSLVELTPAIQGAQINIQVHKENATESIASPEKYQAFQLKINPKSRPVTIDNVPFVKNIVDYSQNEESKNELGKAVEYQGYYQGSTYTINLYYTDEYNNYVQVFENFIKSIELR